MVTSPTVVAVDEASLGLAPVAVARVYEVLRRIVDTGAAVVLVEQYVDRAIDFADHVYVLSKGAVTYSGPATEVVRNELSADYLGDVSP
jgi:branched-chain amino acid transport system ATP-binding protein